MSKYQLIIEVEGKPSCKKRCQFYEGPDGYGYIHCKLAGSGECLSDLLDKCPFKPKEKLKPKQLEWEYDGRSIVSKTKEYIFTINEDNIFGDDYELYLDIETTLYEKNDIDLFDEGCRNIEDAKKFCQEYYNKIFYEMMGE